MCEDRWAPSVLIALGVQPLGPTLQRAFSPPVWSFADRKLSQGWLRCLRAILLDMPLLSTVITSSSLFPESLWAFFLRLFRADLTFACFFFVVVSPPHVLYHSIPSEPAATVFLKTDFVQTPVFISYNKYLELTE